MRVDTLSSNDQSVKYWTPGKVPAMKEERAALVPDRRQRRSRAALAQALVDLLAEQPYDQITVEQIAEAADVTRATFYAHFADKASLLRAVLREVLEELGETVVTSVDADELVFDGTGVRVVLDHAHAHADLFRSVLRGDAGAEARALLRGAFEATATHVLTTMAERSRATPRVPMAFAVGTFVAALLHVVEGSLDETSVVARMAEDGRDGLVDLFIRSQTFGVRWALGLDDVRVVAPREPRRGARHTRG
jgi:AcrR family transcriptional regulator